MTSPAPLVTVGVPVFNGEAFLREALESLISQTEQDLEIIVVDNGSTDATADIVHDLQSTDARIRLDRSPVNRGAAWSHNRAVELARGALFRWAAADDLSNAIYVESCILALEQDPSAVLAYPRVVEVDQDGREQTQVYDLPPMADPKTSVRFRRMVLTSHSCFHVYGLMKTEFLRRTGLIGPYTSSDRVLLAELALHGRFCVASDAVLYHREHEARSMKLYPDADARAAWFDPANAGRRNRPTLRVGRELHAALARVELDPGERIATYGVLAALLWRRRRIWLMEIAPRWMRRTVRELKGRRLPRREGGRRTQTPDSESGGHSVGSEASWGS